MTRATFAGAAIGMPLGIAIGAWLMGDWSHVWSQITAVWMTLGTVAWLEAA